METHIYTKRFQRPVYRTVTPVGPQVFTAPTNSKRVFFNIVFPVGGYEDECPGTGHYLEHMMLQGPFPGQDHPLFKKLVPRGASFTATTEYFRTDYFADGFVEDAAAILRALYQASTQRSFTKEQIELERPVIIEEARLMRNNSDFQIRFAATQFPDHPRLQIRSMGTEEHIRQINEEMLNAYYERNYHIPRIAFFCSGGISHEQHLEIVTELLSDIREQNPASSGYRNPIMPNRFSLELLTPPGDSGRLEIKFNMPLDPVKRTLFRLNESLLDEAPLGILFRKLREERRLVYVAKLEDADFPFETTTLWTTMAAEHFETVHDLIWESIDELNESRFPEELLSMVQSRRRLFFETWDERDSKSALKKMKEMWQRNEYEDIDIRQIVLGATHEQLADVAKEFFRRDNHSILRIKPRSAV